MAMKCCTKLETAKERCPIVFQGISSNFKVTRYKTSPILTQIGRFRTIGRSQLSNPSDLPCLGSSIKFQGHTGWKIDDLNPIWVRLLGRSQLSNPSDLPCFDLGSNSLKNHGTAGGSPEHRCSSCFSLIKTFQFWLKYPQDMFLRIQLSALVQDTVEPLYSTIGGVHEMRSCYRRIVVK